MQYKKEIDGLRAIAVIAVIFFHAGFDLFSGGFVGVDIFFVISGYLITKIIIEEIKKGNFTFLDFYERRIRRIFPALFLVMFVGIPFAWFLLMPSELKSYSKSLIAVPLFVSNIFFWKEGEGYFKTDAELKPLLHTWSLSVEEQFYLFYPLFLIICWRLGRRWLFVLLGTMLIVSFILAQWALTSRPGAAFFLLPTRAWELLIGAFGALYSLKTNYKVPSKKFSEIMSGLGIVLIIFTIFYYSKSLPFPGLYASVPTIGALFIILFANQQTIVGKFIGNKTFVGLGLISYSAYLWHQPVFAYAKFWKPEIDTATKVILIGCILIVSIFSWQYVEKPFRSKNKFSSKYIYVCSLISIIIFIIVGLLLSKTNFRREDMMARELSTSRAIFASNFNERLFIRSRIQHEKSNPHVIVIGSSRVMQVSTKTVNQDILNLSVSGASIEDVIAIWQLSKTKFTPSNFYIGADPWIFNINSNQNRWKSLSEDYKSGMLSLGFININNFSVHEKSSSLNEFIVKLDNSINRINIKASNDLPTIIDKIRNDGSRVYNLSYAHKSAVDIERSASGYISYSMNDYKESTEVREILMRLVQVIKHSNQNVAFILSPYHPTLYKLMEQRDRKFLKIESVFREIAKELEIKVFGSYDPVKVGCTSEEFFDGMHPKDTCMEKVFSDSERHR